MPTPRAKPSTKRTTKVKADPGAAKARPAAASRATKRAAASAANDATVDAYLRALDHPLKSEVEAIRRLILGASPEIREELKWNAPSFFTSEHFVTFNLRARDRVRLIFHTGAKVKAAKGPLEIPDPEGLLEWLGKDRAMVTFADQKEVAARAPALEALVREWIRHL